MSDRSRCDWIGAAHPCRLAWPKPLAAPGLFSMTVVLTNGQK